MKFWARRPDPVLEIAKLFSATLQQQAVENRKLVEVITASSENATKAALATTEVLQKHLDLFKVVDSPEPRIIRDEDEYEAEVNRLRAQGIEVEVPTAPRQELAAVAFSMDIEQMAEEL